MTKRNILKYLSNIDVLIAGLSLIVLIVVTFMGVIMRYFLNDPIVWLQEVQLWCFTWVVFFGCGTAFRTGSHVAIEVLVDKMPPAIQKIIEAFGYIVVITVLTYFLIHGSNLIKQLYDTGRTTNILDIPYPIIYSAFPIGCVLMMINYTIVTIKALFADRDEVKERSVELNGN